MTAAPLISVIVCTVDRPERLLRALRSILAQEAADFEVILVASALEAPPIDDPRIRIVRPARAGTGAARAAGLDAARGAFVAYCDDDDTWTADHLSTLVQVLQDEPDVDLVYGDSEWVQGGISRGVPYSFEFDVQTLAGKNYIFASDVVHRTAAAREAGGFDSSLMLHEDWDLWLRMGARGRLRHVAAVLGQHEWHDACVTAAGQNGDRDAVRVRHQPWVAARPRTAFQPETWTPRRRELIWYSPLAPYLGHGCVARALIGALVADGGVEPLLVPMVSRAHVEPGWERAYRTWDHWGRLGFYYHYDFKPNVMQCERLVTYAMWESTAIPPAHVNGINERAALCYVPCRQNVEAYQEAGVRVPLKVLHHGVDPARFPRLERPRRDTFTFGSFGAFSSRKGIDVLVRAFCDEFRRGEAVRLRLKQLKPEPERFIPTDDPRIMTHCGIVERGELLDFLRELDVFVLPSRGEGFGLCGLEAMATGLPIVATGWSGPVEYMDPDDSYALSYQLVDPQTNEDHLRESRGVKFFGLWAEPDYEHLRALMRHLYDHPDEAASKGARAAARVRRDFSWPRIAREVRQDLDAFAGIGSIHSAAV